MHRQVTDALQHAAWQRQQQQRWRQPQVRPQGVLLASNDYLGLSEHPQVIAAYQQALQQYGTGSGGSALVCGTQSPHLYLQQQLADWLERDNVLLFSSGFAANFSTLLQLGKLYHKIHADRLAHASLIDGMRASGVRWQRFAHNQLAPLLPELTATDQAHLVVTESVFSMDGDSPCLAQLRQVAEHADLYVDDAHGLGVVGADGRSIGGVMNQRQLPLLMVTFGKALGVGGAAVLAPTAVIDYLHNHAREYIYSTAISAAQAAAVSAAIKLVQSAEGSSLRQRLQENIAHVSRLAAEYGIPLMAAPNTAIQLVPVGTDSKALQLQQQLRNRGFVVAAIRPPTVPPGQARLRLTLSASHTPAVLTQLMQELAQCLQH